MDPMIVSLSGEFGVERLEELRELLEPTYGYPYVVIDLTALDYADSACLSEFMRMRQARARSGAWPVCFVLDEDRFGRLFRFLGLDEVFPVITSEKALEYQRKLPKAS